jgi:hypothetical protein
VTPVNGESQVQIDRGHWRYRFALDTANIAIYRSKRTGQRLAPPEVWRSVAALGVSDAFVVAVPGGWQPFVEVADGRQRWTLQRRESQAEAEQTTSHFLYSLADALANAAPAGEADKDADAPVVRLPEPPPAPGEDEAAEEALAKARASREAAGWELIYSRQRVSR